MAPKVFNLESANSQARIRCQSQIVENTQKYNLSVLVCFLERLHAGRFEDLRPSSYPNVKLVQFEKDLKKVVFYESLAGSMIDTLQRGSRCNIYPLDGKCLYLILKYDDDGKLIGHVQYRLQDKGMENVEFTQATTVLCEEMEELGMLDPDVEVYSE